MRSRNLTAETEGRSRRRFRILKRVLISLLVAAMWAAPVASASALEKDQIVQMSKLGMENNAIKGAIDGAGQELELTPEELGELRAAGVDAEIIEYLKATGHVVGDDSTDEQAPTPADDGAEGGPAPAPVPDDEEEAEDLTAEEQQKLIEQRAKELNEKKLAEEKRQRQIQSVARKLPQAARAVQEGRNMAAAKTYLQFLSLDPDQESENFYEATFGLAKALYQEGILSGAANPLLDVIRAGAQRPHFKEAFYMLEELTKRIGYQPPVLEEMTKFYVGDMNAKFKNDFHYYLGKFFFDYGRSDLAVEYLGKVEQGAQDYPEALYLMGAAQLQQENKTGAALKNFERAILAGEKEPGGNQEILQLGYLALARVFYEVGYYDVALYYYQKIPSNSARNATATFETAWTYFVKNDYKRALGTFHTLHSPYYTEWYFPDLYILESTVYLNLCQFGKSKQVLARFQEDFLDKRPLLEKFLTETEEPKAYWNAITGIYENDKPKEAAGLPPMFANAVLDELSFYNIYGMVRTLENERVALEKNVSALGEFGQQVIDRVDRQLETKIEEGGILVRQKLTDVSAELKDWENKAFQISFDIDNEEKEQMQQALRNQGQVEEKVTEQGTTLLIVADDFTPWPFEGEYWQDEVTNYRSRLRTQCAAQ